MDNPEDKISKLLSDPENLKTIAKLASGFMSSGSAEAPSTETVGEASTADSADSAHEGEGTALHLPVSASVGDDGTASSKSTSSFLSGILGDNFSTKDVDKSIGLLGALKPYLGVHKKETCELLIKALGAVKLFGMYKS